MAPETDPANFDIETRFWRLVEVRENDACWFWRGSTFRGKYAGYGCYRLWRRGKKFESALVHVGAGEEAVNTVTFKCGVCGKAQRVEYPPPKDALDLTPPLPPAGFTRLSFWRTDAKTGNAHTLGIVHCEAHDRRQVFTLEIVKRFFTETT